MEHPALQAFERRQLRSDIPYFQQGDTVRVNIRVVEGDKERIQAFEGVVISRSSGGVGETFKVRKISFGTGVERTFLINSPRIESIKVITRGHVRRAKLYYLRDRVGKGTRIRKRRKRLNPDFIERATALPPMPKLDKPAVEQVETAPAQEPAEEQAAAEDNAAEEQNNEAQENDKQ